MGFSIPKFNFNPFSRSNAPTPPPAPAAGKPAGGAAGGTPGGTANIPGYNAKHDALPSTQDLVQRDNRANGKLQRYDSNNGARPVPPQLQRRHSAPAFESFGAMPGFYGVKDASHKPPASFSEARHNFQMPGDLAGFHGGAAALPPAPTRPQHAPTAPQVPQHYGASEFNSPAPTLRRTQSIPANLGSEIRPPSTALSNSPWLNNDGSHFTSPTSLSGRSEHASGLAQMPEHPGTSGANPQAQQRRNSAPGDFARPGFASNHMAANAPWMQGDGNHFTPPASPTGRSEHASTPSEVPSHFGGSFEAPSMQRRNSEPANIGRPNFAATPSEIPSHFGGPSFEAPQPSRQQPKPALPEYDPHASTSRPAQVFNPSEVPGLSGPMNFNFPGAHKPATE